MDKYSAGIDGIGWVLASLIVLGFVILVPMCISRDREVKSFEACLQHVKDLDRCSKLLSVGNDLRGKG